MAEDARRTKLKQEVATAAQEEKEAVHTGTDYYTTAENTSILRKLFKAEVQDDQEIIAELDERYPYFPKEVTEEWSQRTNYFAAAAAGAADDDDDDDEEQTTATPDKPVKSALEKLTRKATNMGVELEDWLENFNEEAKIGYLKERILNKTQLDLLETQLKALKLFSRISGNLVEVDYAINEMARFSQAGGSLASTREVGTGTREQVDHENAKRQKTGASSAGAPSKLVKKLLSEPHPLDAAIFDPAKQTTKRTDIDGKMRIVAKVINEWITRATILVGVNSNSTDTRFAQSRADYKEKIQMSSNWFRKRVKEDLEEGGTTKGEATQSDNKKLFFPGAVGYEVEGCQIVVFAVLEAISECLLWDQPGHVENEYSPSKTKVMREAVLVGEDRHVRKVDVVLLKESRACLVMHDKNMRLTIELMPVCRNGQTVTDLLLDKRDQAVGHAAKSIAGAFNLLGVGASGKATVLSGSFAFLRVHHLKLTMAKLPVLPVGEDQCATLDYQESTLLPLMSKTSFQKVLDDSELDENKYGELQEYAEKCFSSADTDVPLGIRLVFELMQKSRHDLLGYNMEEIALEKDIKVLGTGTFGVIVADGRDSNTVLKVSTFPSTDHFAKEVAALSALGNDEVEGANPPRSHLPHLLDKDSEFRVQLGWKTLGLPCLKLKPRGVPVLSTHMDAEEVIVACSQICAGMRFLHSKDLVHCDISPKNIVVVANSHYVLVDLGLTTNRSERLRGFQGTVPYAAEDIFSQYPNGMWSPIVAHDEAALQYTMAALLNGGIPAWDMHPFPQYPEEGDELKTQEDDFSRVIEERKAAVESLFDEHGVHWDWAESKLIKKKN